MDYIENLQVFGENFSITNKLKEFTINEEFQGQTTIWDVVSGSCEEIGSVIYEKLINFIKNTKDLDYCSLHSLYAIAKELDVGESFTYDIIYPSELNKLMNVFSMNPSHFYKNDTMSSTWMEMFKLDFPLRVKEIEGENLFKCLTTDLYSNSWKNGQVITPQPSAMTIAAVGTDCVKYKIDSISTSVLSGYTAITNNSQTHLPKLSSHFILNITSEYERFYFTMRINEHADRAICVHGLIHWYKKTPTVVEIELFEYKRIGNLLIEVEGETRQSLNCNISFEISYNNTTDSNTKILTVTPTISRASILFMDFTADVKFVITHVTSKYNKVWESPTITNANIVNKKIIYNPAKPANEADIVDTSVANYSTDLLLAKDVGSFMIDQETLSSGIYVIKAVKTAAGHEDEVVVLSELYILRDINSPEYINCIEAHVLKDSPQISIRLMKNKSSGGVDKILIKPSGILDVTYKIMKLAATPFDPKLLLDNNVSSYCQTYGPNTIIPATTLNEIEFNTKKILHYENGKFTKNRFTYNEEMTNDQVYSAYTFGTYDIMVLNNDYNSKIYYNINILNLNNGYNDFIHETATNTAYSIPIDRTVTVVKQTYDNENKKMVIVMDSFNSFFMSSMKTLKLIQSFPEDFNYSTLYGKWIRLGDTNTLEVTAVMVDLNTNDIIEISNETNDYKNRIAKEQSDVYPDITFPTTGPTSYFMKYKITDILRPGIFRVSCLDTSAPTVSNILPSPCVIQINSQLINLVEKAIGRLIDSKIIYNYQKYVLDKLSTDKKLTSLSIGDRLLADQAISERNTYAAFLDSILPQIMVKDSKYYPFSEVLTNFDKQPVSTDSTDTSIEYNILNAIIHTNLLKSRKILRTICTKAALMRDVFKYVAQKHSMIGTVNAIQKVMEEYILRSYTKRTDWRMNVETLGSLEESGVNSSLDLEEKLPYLSEWASSRNTTDSTLNTVLNADFAIKIVEYKDTTEYFNVSAQSAMKYVVDTTTSKQIGIEYKTVTNPTTLDVEIVATPITTDIKTYKTDGYVIPEETQKNVRFWEVGEVDLYNNSILKKSDFIEFYKNLGFDYTQVSSTTNKEVTDDAEIYATVNSLLKARGGIYDVHAPSGLDRLSILPEANLLTDALTFSDMSVMQNLYSETSNNEIMSAINHKNITYSTIAPQPWLYNFVEIILGQYPKMLSTLLPSTTTEKYNIENTQVRWTDITGANLTTGLTIDSWRSANQEFIGYQTFYEESNNYDIYNKADPDIDRDGPVKLEALADFLNSTSTDVTNYSNMQKHYEHFMSMCATTDRNIIWDTYYLPKLKYEFKYDHGVPSTYLEEIIKLKDKVISQYAFDQYNNHYMLYKDLQVDSATDIKTDPHGGPGEIWVRLANHPLPYKLSLFNTSNDLSHANDMSKDTTAYTIDTTLENLAIYHFDINENIMIIHGECFLADDIPPKRILICDINYRFSDISLLTNTNDFNIDLLKVRTIKIYENELYLGHYATQSNIVFFILDAANQIRIEYFDIDNYAKIKQSATSIPQMSAKALAGRNPTTAEVLAELTVLEERTIKNIATGGKYKTSTTNRIRGHYPAVWTTSYDKFYVACETEDDNIFVLEFDKLNPDIYIIYEYDTFNIL